MIRPRALPATAAALVLWLTACAPSVGPVDQIEVPFPSPLSGPGRPSLAPTDQQTVELAWRLLLEDSPGAAASRAALTGDAAPARLLILQVAYVEGTSPTAEDLAELAREHPDYAAAWITLSVAAEREGDEATALAAARHGADLWPSRIWQRRAGDLHELWVGRRVDEAQAHLDQGEAEAALVLLEPALILEPSNHAGLLATARALFALDRLDEAGAVLERLSDDDDAAFLYGNVAERQRDWQLALDQYELLPADYPGREAALKRTRTRWRLSNMPAYVQEALASEALDRAEMAVLLVALAPQVTSLGQGRVPLLTDVVEMPSHRELVAAVQAGLVGANLIEPKLHPNWPVDGAQVQTAVERMCELLGMETPTWCAPLEGGNPSCVLPDSLLTGQALARLVLEVVHGESP